MTKWLMGTDKEPKKKKRPTELGQYLFCPMIGVKRLVRIVEPTEKTFYAMDAGGRVGSHAPELDKLVNFYMDNDAYQVEPYMVDKGGNIMFRAVK